jgi:predicted nuclease of restriction endonuclease-like (RecB) superfamily
VDAFLGISFTHHLLLLNKCGNMDERLFYMRYVATAYWSVSVLEHHIQERFYQRQGKLPHNFTQTINSEITDKAIELFKDEYLLDFLNLTSGADERKIESKIVTNIRDFVLRMGKGFAFIGNQFRLEVGGKEFFIDLLFYNRILQCLVAFELKKGDFKPEYTGQLNFYLNVLDDKIKLPNEHASIGIILCKERNDTIVQYSLRTTNNPIGVAKYKISDEIPKEVLTVLPNLKKLKELM